MKPDLTKATSSSVLQSGTLCTQLLPAIFTDLYSTRLKARTIIAGSFYGVDEVVF